MAEVVSDKRVNVCHKPVKDDDGKEHECGTVLPKGYPDCKNRRSHMLPYKTGLCAVGACEGIRKLGSGGRPLKPCDFWKACPCECHKTFDAMFLMSGLPRRFVDNSGWSPEHSPYWMPTLEERAAMRVAQQAGVASAEEVRVASPLPEAIPDTYKRTFNATPTGRAARGELEFWVQQVCDEFLVERYEEPCTPAFVSAKVGKRKDGAPPSPGAVNAVFERWVKIGFAIIDKKPTRFTGYTAEGVKLGLDALKLRAQDSSRSKNLSVGLRTR